MNRNLALIATGLGVGASAALFLRGKGTRTEEEQPATFRERLHALRSRRGAAKDRDVTREKSSRRKVTANGSHARWLLGGSGGALAAWGAANRGPLANIAGLAGAAMLSKATIRLD